MPLLRRTALPLALTVLPPALAVLPLAPAAVPHPLSAQVDLLLRGGTVVDGTGGPVRTADIAIRDGRIVAVGALEATDALRVVDLRGLHVAPGFIDLHSHADGAYGRIGLSDRLHADARNLVTQGITTAVVGQDGWHAWPVGSTLSARVALWRAHGTGLNVVPLAGYAATRREVLGWETTPPDEAQRGEIARRIEGYLDEGAWGVSTAREFFPYVTVDEVVAALEPVGRRGGVHLSHVRDYADELLPAIEEFLEIARRSGVRSVVSHLKAVGPRNWGAGAQAVGRLAAARAEGLEVFADQYPHRSPFNHVGLVPGDAVMEGDDPLLPPGPGSPRELLAWAHARSPATAHAYTLDFLVAQDEERVLRTAQSLTRSLLGDDHAFRSRLRATLEEPARSEALLEAVTRRIDGLGGPEHISVFGHPDPGVVGRTLAQVAAARDVPAARAAVELTLEDARFVPEQHSAEDVAAIMSQPFVAGSSDGWITEYGVGSPQPRSYGAFVRRLEVYVVELGFLDLPEAVRQVTSLPATIVGLEDRGVIAPGYAADLVVLDLDRLEDRAGPEEAHRFPVGVEWVLVNGVAVVEDGRPTGARPGRVLLRETR